ncbi:MAG: hypothetical protein PHC35_07150 [Deltaproteobacteria bacterium]|nr:hypothetical protein [Deltaproteobacteria bacterium]
MMVKANSAIFIGRNARLSITAGQSVISGITSGMGREPVMDMEFRRDEKGGSGEVFVK